MNRVETDLESYEQIMEQMQELKDVLYELNQLSLQNNKASQVLNRAVSSKDDESRRLMNAVEASLAKTQGLPITRGFINKDNQNVAFKMKKGSIRIDTKKSIEICKKIFLQVRNRNIQNSKSFQNDKKVADFAAKENLSLDEAKKLMDEKDIGRFNDEKRKTDIIDKTLKIQIPAEIRGKFTEEQISNFYKKNAEDQNRLEQYEDSNNKLAELRRNIDRQQDVLNRLHELPLSDKDKKKIAKFLQKSIKKQETRANKVNKKNLKTKQKLSKYLDNIESYKAFIEAHERNNISRFDSMEAYKDALAKGLIGKDEQFAIGAPNQEDKDFENKFWQAEIQSANVEKNKNVILQLPEPSQSKNSFKDSINYQINEKEAIERAQKETQRDETNIEGPEQE